MPMGKVWIPARKSKWWLPKQRMLTVYHYCLQYPEWEDTYRALGGGSGIRGVTYDGMPHGTGVGNPTEAAALRTAEVSMKMQKLRDTVQEVAPDIYLWLLKGVTEGVSYEYLKSVMGIPCGHNYYWEKRRQFYWTMSQRM